MVVLVMMVMQEQMSRRRRCVRKDRGRMESGKGEIVRGMERRRQKLNTTELSEQQLARVRNEMELGGHSVHAQRHGSKEHLVEKAAVQRASIAPTRQSVRRT